MPLNEFRNLKENGSASAAELAEFMAQLRGKRPQEVLGLVAQSGLTRGMASATVAVLVVLAVFTVLPYAWGKISPEKAKVAVEKPAEKAEVVKPPAAATPKAAPKEEAVAPAKPSQAEIMQKLGVGEAKKSDPLINPLENRTDDLLKDLK
jgi:hypothetical protein